MVSKIYCGAEENPHSRLRKCTQGAARTPLSFISGYWSVLNTLVGKVLEKQTAKPFSVPKIDPVGGDPPPPHATPHNTKPYS